MNRKTHRGGTSPPSIQVSEQGLGRNEMVMMALSIATIVLSIAVWKVATGVKWALIILASGQSGYWLFVGAGHFARMRLEGRALLEQAKRGMRLELGAQVTGRLIGRGGDGA